MESKIIQPISYYGDLCGSKCGGANGEQCQYFGRVRDVCKSGDVFKRLRQCKNAEKKYLTMLYNQEG